jgi:polysaccharide pyruvyl transferase WcaK-like protein
VGAGPVEGGLSRQLFRFAARQADHRSYRDEASRQFAKNVLGLAVSGDRVTPDLVFGLDIEAPPPAAKARVVGIGVMTYHNWLGRDDAPDQYEPYLSKLAEFAHGLLAEGRTIRLLAGDQVDAETVADFSSRLTSRAPEHAGAVASKPTSTLRELCAEIALTDVVVATRYHTIIGALMCGRPAVSIGYAEKNAAVMRAFDLGEYCQDISSFDVETLRRHFAAVAANPSLASADLLSVAQRLRGEVREHLARVAAEIQCVRITR